MLPRSTKGFVRNSLAASLGVVSLYTIAEEERRRRAFRIAQAGYRISNLVSTVGILVVDYGYTLYLGPINQHHINKHVALNAQISTLQTKLDNLVLEQFQCSDRKKLDRLQGQITKTRDKIDSLAEEVAQLSTEDAASPLKEIHDRSAIRLRDMCEGNQGVYIKLGQHLAMLDHLLPDVREIKA
jgi:outer membrane murein-binding lipoprotein Lpp